MTPWDPSLPPGSDDAKDAGCFCPAEENNLGRGKLLPDSDGVVYVFTLGCPVHDA